MLEEERLGHGFSRGVSDTTDAPLGAEGSCRESLIQSTRVHTSLLFVLACAPSSINNSFVEFSSCLIDKHRLLNVRHLYRGFSSLLRNICFWRSLARLLLNMP